ncbi:MAG TPA: DUF1840 domain-containing protein [Rhodocyclaceae bacterium]|nr:DUF1840 domain-containing protein [Rhodocyclaceae bacterium]
MIVIFKSKAAGDVIMFGDAAHALMKIMGKSPDAKGIITPEQLPSAIAALKTAIDGDKSSTAKVDEEIENAKPAMEKSVSLAQRAIPLLELLEWSDKKKVPVTWGT